MNAFRFLHPVLASLVLGFVAPSGSTAEANAAVQPTAAVAEHTGHQHEHDQAAQSLQLRYVTHLGCRFGWTGIYWVYVPGYTNLICSGCGQPMTVYFPY